MQIKQFFGHIFMYIQVHIYTYIGNKYYNMCAFVYLLLQSSGKSSVLESIVGRDFLPRGSGKFSIYVFLYFVDFSLKSDWMLRNLKEIIEKVNVFLGIKVSSQLSQTTLANSFIFTSWFVLWNIFLVLQFPLFFLLPSQFWTLFCCLHV